MKLKQGKKILSRWSPNTGGQNVCSLDLSDGLTKNIDKVNYCPPLTTIESTLTLTFDRHKIIVK